MNIIETLRQFRIGPFAIFDIAAAYLGMYLLAPILSNLISGMGVNMTRKQWLWLTIPIGVVAHLLVGQETALNKMLLDPNGGYIAKIIVGLMVLAAFLA